jgi:hypothetical protein
MTRPSKSPRINGLINQSAVLYLLLDIWLGPRHVFWLVILVITIVAWRSLSDQPIPEAGTRSQRSCGAGLAVGRMAGRRMATID